MNPIPRHLRVMGQMSDLARITNFVEESSEEAGVDPAARFDLQLAVEEACTNIIQHAYGGQGGEIEVDFEAAGADVTITIRDWGEAFSPEEANNSDLSLPLEERAVGGLGLHLMGELMDEVRFTFAPGGNTLVMTKRGIVPPARWADAA